MNMADVLAQQTYIHRRSPGRCSCGEHLESPSDASHAKHLAELQLDALKAAGYAVVNQDRPDAIVAQGFVITPVTPGLTDRVAEAICASTGSGRMFPWSTLSESERDAWRQMATAAIAAGSLAAVEATS